MEPGWALWGEVGFRVQAALLGRGEPAIHKVAWCSQAGDGSRDSTWWSSALCDLAGSLCSSLTGLLLVAVVFHPLSASEFLHLQSMTSFPLTTPYNFSLSLFFAVLAFELRAYTLSHWISPVLY
jgi:hypothetical protein